MKGDPAPLQLLFDRGDDVLVLAEKGVAGFLDQGHLRAEGAENEGVFAADNTRPDDDDPARTFGQGDDFIGGDDRRPVDGQGGKWMGREPEATIVRGVSISTTVPSGPGYPDPVQGEEGGPALDRAPPCGSGDANG